MTAGVLPGPRDIWRSWATGASPSYPAPTASARPTSGGRASARAWPNGLDLDEAYVRQGAYTVESGAEAARSLLAMPEPPTAIFAGNDEMAIGVMKAARDAGLDVPRDLSIVGFDDLPMASRVWPNQTTVRLPIRDMGRMAAEKLTARSRGLDPAVLVQPEVDPSLVVRDSTATPGR